MVVPKGIDGGGEGGHGWNWLAERVMVSTALRIGWFDILLLWELQQSAWRLTLESEGSGTPVATA